jgi:hypothetical protein
VWVELDRIILARGSHAGRRTEAGSKWQGAKQVSRKACRYAEALVGRLRARQERPTGRLGQRQAEAGMHTEARRQR